MRFWISAGLAAAMPEGARFATEKWGTAGHGQRDEFVNFSFYPWYVSHPATDIQRRREDEEEKNEKRNRKRKEEREKKKKRRKRNSLFSALKE